MLNSSPVPLRDRTLKTIHCLNHLMSSRIYFLNWKALRQHKREAILNNYTLKCKKWNSKRMEMYLQSKCYYIQCIHKIFLINKIFKKNLE